MTITERQRRNSYQLEYEKKAKS